MQLALGWEWIPACLTFAATTAFGKPIRRFRKLGLSFVDLADPRWFAENPAQAWGFYGHRLELYRRTDPHAGYQLLKQWAESKAHGGFSFTSNVDCHFQSAGFDTDRIVECHGSFSQLQCREPCTQALWSSADTKRLDRRVNNVSNRAIADVPSMRGYFETEYLDVWATPTGSGDRTHDQNDRLNSWLSGIPKSAIAIIEIGAGTAVPSVRRFSERLVEQKQATLIRINPRESLGPAGTISIAAAGLETLKQIDELL